MPHNVQTGAQPVRKAEATPAIVHRLHDMVTEEVSLVDRPANKRPFLVVKNEGMNMPHGAEVVAGPNGALTAKPTALTPPAPAQTTKASLSLTKVAQDALANVIADCLAAMTDAQKMVEGATLVETEEEMDAGDVADTLMTCAEDIEDALYSMFGDADVDAQAASTEETAPPGATTPVAQQAPPLDFGKRFEVRRAKRVIAKVEASQLIGTTIQKYGRKLKKERAMRLQQAMTLLSSVISEVMPAVSAAAGEVDTTKAKPPMPPAKDDDVDPKTGKPKKKPGAGAAPAAPPPGAATKSETAEDVTKRVSVLEVELKKANEALASLRKNVTPSNATTVEGTPERVDDGFSWPMDMNSPIEKPGSKNRFGE